jgi:hypothetical protein
MAAELDRTTAPEQAARAPKPNVARGLLWREWIAHREIVIHALAVWLVLGWVLIVFNHPGWIIAFGVLYAWLTAPRFGGAEAAEGSEEFSFSLPPQRTQRYLTRLALGGATLLAFTGFGVLAIGLDLPQTLWGIFVSSGFTEPFPACRPRYLYALALACPVAVFSFTFVVAANASSRGLVSWSWLVGSLAAAGVLAGGFLSERLVWGELNGVVSSSALIALSASALLAGHQLYVRKEGISRPAPLPSGGLLWVLAVVLVVIILVLFTMH